MPKENLEQALQEWIEKKGRFERELAINSSPIQKYELEKRIEECDQNIQRLENYKDSPPIRPPKIIPRRSIATLTGTGCTIIVLIIRWLGFLQPMELSIYDHLLLIRPKESYDDRITIIGATAEDLAAQRERNETGALEQTISNQALKEILDILSQENVKPAIIALDLYRDFKTNEPLEKTFQKLQQDPDLDIFAVCESPNSKDEGTDPPLTKFFPSKYVGFANFIPDEDEVLRRQLIEMPARPDHNCQSEQSLGFLVALRYLEKHSKQKFIYNELWTPEGNLTLNGTELKRINTYAFGGYQYVDANGVQFLLNYRTPTKDLSEITQKPLSIEAVRQRKILTIGILEKYLKDRIVIIGVTDKNVAKDIFKTPYGKAVGATIHAHMISQIISTVLDERQLIWVWSQWVEAGWIFLWGLTGGIIAVYVKPRLISLAAIIIAGCIICGTVATIFITKSGWVPMLPPMMVLTFSGASAGHLHRKITLYHTKSDPK